MNKELMIETLNWIRENNERWDQSLYVTIKFELPSYNIDLCNTKFCFAGAALFLANQVRISGEDGDGQDIYPVDKDGDKDTWQHAAQELLDLTYEQMYSIFYAVTDNFENFNSHVLWVIDNPDASLQELEAHRKMISI